MTATSPLDEAGGWLVLECVHPDFVPHLADEACRASRTMYEDRRAVAGDAANGDPDRWLLRADGGDALDTLYHSPGLLDLLAELTGTRWARTGDHASYAYYCRPGHYLGRHLDAADCGLAVITCVRDQRTRPDDGAGALRVHTEAARDVRLGVGQTLVLRGTVIPHEVLPVETGQVRITAALCFRPLLADDVPV